MLQNREKTLPPELLLHICSMLDPADSSDRATLARVARSSRALYELVAPMLYRELVLDDLGLLNLLACGHRLSRSDADYGAFTAEDCDFIWPERVAQDWGHLPAPSARWRRSLGMVRSLTVIGPILGKTLLLLWDVCVPGETLFPNVSALKIRDSQQARETSWPQRDYGPPVHPDAGVVLFDRPDYCGMGYSVGPLLDRLPTRDSRFGHVSLHTGMPHCFTPPKAWATFRVFEYEPATLLTRLRCVRRCRRHGPALQPRDIDSIARNPGRGLVDFSKDGPVEFCIALREASSGRALEGMEEGYQYTDEEREITRRWVEDANEDWKEIAELARPLHPNLKIALGSVDDPNPPECPPCGVCSECWQCRTRLTCRPDVGAAQGDVPVMGGRLCHRGLGIAVVASVSWPAWPSERAASERPSPVGVRRPKARRMRASTERRVVCEVSVMQCTSHANE